MALTHFGSMTLGAALPTALGAQAAGAAGISGALADAEVELAGALGAQAQLTLNPPSVGATAAAAALLALEVQPPNVSGQLLVTADLVAELQLLIGQLRGYLEILAAFGVTLGGAGVHLYGYTGRADELGPAVRTALLGGLPGGSPSDPAAALLLVASTAEGRAALGAIAGLQL